MGVVPDCNRNGLWVREFCRFSQGVFPAAIISTSKYTRKKVYSVHKEKYETYQIISENT